jgi:lysophospholipase L1-like esterase
MRSARPLLALLLLTACAPASVEPAPDPTPTPEPTPPLDPGGPSLPPEYDDAPAERLIFLGDSITAGEGAPAGRAYRTLLIHNDDARWPEFVGLDLTTAWPDLGEILDVSRGGHTSRNLVEQQLTSLDEQLDGPVDGATVSVLTIGGNDMQIALAAFLAQGEEASRERVDIFLANLELAVDTLTDPERFPDGARVYLANVYEPTDGEGQHEACFAGLDLTDMLLLLEEANLGIRALAKDRGVAMIDLRSRFLGHGFWSGDEGFGDDDRWFRDDCIHPNERGHHEIRSMFWDLLQPAD